MPSIMSIYQKFTLPHLFLAGTRPSTASRRSGCTGTATLSPTWCSPRTATSPSPDRGTRRSACGTSPPARPPAASRTTPRFVWGLKDCFTGWGGHLFRRFCNLFSKSSPCLLGQHGSCRIAQQPGEQFTKPMELVTAPTQ